MEQPKFYDTENTVNLDHLPKIEGFDFDKKFDFDKFIESYKTTGFQATNFGRAIAVMNSIKRAKKEKKATIFLSCTSNMISSGVREVIKFLVKNKHVDVLVVSAGGVEEDIIKCLKPFHMGKFNVSGRSLFESGVARIGNIFVPNDRYLELERWLRPVFEKMYKEQKDHGKIYSVFEFTKLLGTEIDNEESVLYWCAKNDIPVFCPAITDGAIGDLVYFFKKINKEFMMDITTDTVKIVDIAQNTEEAAAILLGGGAAKHYTLNANIFRDGLEYAVYINTGEHYDGSDSGADIEEAKTWAKIKPNAQSVKVHGDATIIFPLLVASTWGKPLKEKPL